MIPADVSDIVFGFLPDAKKVSMINKHTNEIYEMKKKKAAQTIFKFMISKQLLNNPESLDEDEFAFFCARTHRLLTRYYIAKYPTIFIYDLVAMLPKKLNRVLEFDEVTKVSITRRHLLDALNSCTIDEILYVGW
jgi:hypothetical protein